MNVSRTKKSIIRRYILRSFYLLCLLPLIHMNYSVIDGLYDNHSSADIAVILGNKVNKDGSLSERLTQRLQTGLALYQSGRVNKIIVSGGLGKEGFYEGDKMRFFLLKNNVPESDIITDNHGDNTLLTVKNTLKLQTELGFKSIIVVSQYYHVSRTKMLFKKNGFMAVSSASPYYFELRDLYSLFREFIAYYRYKFF